MKIKALFYSITLFFITFTWPLLAADQAAITDLESVLNRASSLQEFLDSTDLQKAYYDVALKYYGGAEHFSEKSYQAILKSFKEALTTIPNLADRAWKIRSVRDPIILQSTLKEYAVKPKSESWRSFLQEFGFDLTGAGSPVTFDETEAKLKDIEAEIQKIEADVPENLTPRKRQEFIAAKYKNLKKGNAISLARSLVLRHISGITLVRNKLTSLYGDVALETIDQIRNRPGEILPVLSPYLRAIKLVLNAIPQARTLADNRDLFDKDNDFKKVHGSEFHFTDLPRRFHALFRGIPHKECVGGSERNVNLLTPRRYLIPLLEGGHEIHILKDGKYSGYISTVAVDKSEKHFLSLEVMSGEVAGKSLIPEVDSEIYLYRRPIFALWFSQETKRTLGEMGGYDGYVVGQSFAIDNANGLYAIRTSGPWIEGSDAGKNTEFRTADLLESNIVALPKPDGLPVNYDTGKMIYDLSVKDASHAVLLKPGDFDDAILDDSEWLKKRISGGLFTEALTWATFRYLTPENAEVRSVLYDEAWLILKAINDTNHRLHSSALQFLGNCGPVCMEGIFRASYPIPLNSFARFINGIDWVLAMPENRRFNLVNDYLNRHLERGLELAFQEINIAEAINKVKDKCNNIATSKKIILAGIAKAKTAKEYLEFSAPGVSAPSNAYLKEIALLHNENFEKFMEFKPTNAELFELKERLITVAQTETLAKIVVSHAQTISDLMPALSREPFKNPTEDLLKNVDQLISDNADLFFKLKPTIKDLVELRSQIHSIKTLTFILGRALSDSVSTADFIRLIEAYYGATPSDETKSAVAEILINHLGHFISLEPSIESLLKLRPYTKTVNQELALLRAGLPLVKSPKDYIDLVSFTLLNSTKPMVIAAEKFVQDTTAEFQKTRPWHWHWKRLRKMYPKLDLRPPKTGFNKSCIELLTRPIF